MDPTALPLGVRAETPRVTAAAHEVNDLELRSGCNLTTFPISFANDLSIQFDSHAILRKTQKH